MWLMTTKGRPHAAEEVAGICWDTGMKQPAIMYVDGDPSGYEGLKLPDNWSMTFGDGNLAGSKQYVFEHFPNERVYGWIADDNVPETMHWCNIVEYRAYPWNLVHCRDYFVSDIDEEQLRRTKNLGGGICWGGDLIRSVGFWAPNPDVIVQGGIDWFWTSLCGDTPIGIYLEDVVVRHDNWRTGRREADNNDDLEKPHIQNDLRYMKCYLQTNEFIALRKRVLREYKSRRP